MANKFDKILGEYREEDAGTGGSGSTAWGAITGTLSAQTDLQAALDLKAPLDSPTFTTLITGSYLNASQLLITDSNKTIISASTDFFPSPLELSCVKGVTSSLQTQIELKAPIASPTFTGTVTIPTPFTLGATSVTATGTQLNYLNAATGTTGSTTTNLVYSKSPTLTGTPFISPTAPINNHPYSAVNDEATTNLVVNPSFEVNVTDGWSTKGTATRTRDTTEAWSGDASMKMVVSLDNSGAVTSSMAVDASATYVGTLRVKGAVGGEYVAIVITGNNSGASSSEDGFVAFTGSYLFLTTEWTEIRWFKTMNGSDTTATLAINSIDATPITIYVDGVTFEKKTVPSYLTTENFGSSYCDGSLGEGYSWSGTEHNSTSSRTAGWHFTAPISDNNGGAFIQRRDGSFGGKMTFKSDWNSTNKAVGPGQTDIDEPHFPFEFNGRMYTNTAASGVSAGLVLIDNQDDGTALYVKSAAISAYAMVIDGSSIFNGTILGIYAASDLATMISGGGKFFEFADKSGKSSFQWTPVFSQSGVFNLPYQQRYTFTGGGGQTTTDRTGLTGTVVLTTNSSTVTGTLTTFLTDFHRGDAFLYVSNAATSVYTLHQVKSIESDTSMTLTANSANTVSAREYKGKARQYYPATLQVAGAYSDHANQTGGDYVYSLFPNGSNGQLHVTKSSALMSLTAPTENSGDAIVTTRLSNATTTTISATATETTIITGYTSPANELYAGKRFRIKFFGDIDTVLTTSTITWRVKLGGTTILTSVAKQSGTLSLMHFEGEITIVGTSLTAQRSVIKIIGDDNTLATPAANIYGLVTTGVGAVDMRIDRALTVTAQFSDASTMNVYHAGIEII